MRRKLKRPTSIVLFVVIATVLLIIDRVTKMMALEHLNGILSQPFIPSVLDFHLTFNEGAAFGLFEGGAPIFLALALIVTCALFLYLLISKRHAVFEVVSLALIAAGALGNAIDRIREGHVIDFLRTLFIDFPIFNVADSCITVGVIFLIIFIFFDGRESGKTPRTTTTEGKNDA